MKQNDAEEIIELTEIVEEPNVEGDEPDEEAIRKAFEEDDFFSKIEEMDELSDSLETEEPEEESLPEGDESFDELLEGDEEDLEPDPGIEEGAGEEPSEEEFDLENIPEPVPEDSATDEMRLAAELDTSFELAESTEEPSEESEEAEAIEQEDVDDEFEELEDFKIDVSVPPSDSENMDAADEGRLEEQPGASSLPADDAEDLSAGQTSAHEALRILSPEKAEAVLERVAREVLGEAAERIFSKVAEEVLKEEIERIRAEIGKLSNPE